MGHAAPASSTTRQSVSRTTRWHGIRTQTAENHQVRQICRLLTPSDCWTQRGQRVSCEGCQLVLAHGAVAPSNPPGRTCSSPLWRPESPFVGMESRSGKQQPSSKEGNRWHAIRECDDSVGAGSRRTLSCTDSGALTNGGQVLNLMDGGGYTEPSQNTPTGVELPKITVTRRGWNYRIDPLPPDAIRKVGNLANVTAPRGGSGSGGGAALATTLRATSPATRGPTAIALSATTASTGWAASISTAHSPVTTAAMN